MNKTVPPKTRTDPLELHCVWSQVLQKMESKAELDAEALPERVVLRKLLGRRDGVDLADTDASALSKLNRWRLLKLIKINWARSRLYRSQILQVNTRWKALAEIYTMHSFAPLCNLKFLSKCLQNL